MQKKKPNQDRDNEARARRAKRDGDARLRRLERDGKVSVLREELPPAEVPPPALSMDQLLRRLIQLEAMVAVIRKPDQRFGQRQSIFPARITSGAQWVEQTVSSGALADITSGGRACTSNSDACAYIDPGDSVFLYEIQEGDEIRYVQISGGGSGTLDPGTLTGQVYQMVTDNTAAWQLPVAHSVE